MKSREDIYKITSIVLLLDQFIKLLINNLMKLGQEIEVIPNFFSLLYVKNTGAAFSILRDSTLLLIIISVLIIIILDKEIKKQKSFTKLNTLALGMIMGGIFGNLIDRILHHGVIDYLSFRLFNHSFPIFNLADIGITVGVALFIINMFIEKKR